MHRLATALACALVAATAAAQEPVALEPYVACVERGSFAVRDVVRAGQRPSSRSVNTAEGERRVSVADGYRVMLNTPQGEPFVNLKIELSAPGKADEDRAVIVAQMRAMAGGSAAGALPLKDETRDGVQAVGLDNPSIDHRSIISFYTLFVAPKGLVATAYVLNQKPERRAFASLSEYQVLRDKALSEIAACLRLPGAGS